MIIPDLDSSELSTSFTKFYNSLEEDPKLLRFFQHKELFTLHGSNAILVAELLYKTTTVLKKFSSLVCCTVTKPNAQVVMKNVLLDLGFKVEIWANSGGKWEITSKATPGNLTALESLLFEHSDMSSLPVIASIYVEVAGIEKIVGVAFTDYSAGRILGISQFSDNDSFSGLEALLIQQSVKECILQKETASNTDLKAISSLIERIGIDCTHVKTASFNSENASQDLKTLCKSERFIVDWENATALKSVACLIVYLELLRDEENLGKYSVVPYNLNNYMKLDASAVKALNLIPGPKEGTKKTNIYNLLNKCRTAQGSRLLMNFIKQPLLSVDLIVERQNLVKVFFNDTLLRQDIQEISLKAFPDLHRLSKKFQRGKAGLQDVVRIYQVVKNLPAMIERLEEYDQDHKDLIEEKFLTHLRSHASSLIKLEELVETTIDLQASDNHEFIIKADYDEGLAEVQERKDAIFKMMKPEARNIALATGLEFDKKLKFEHNPQYGYHLRLSRADYTKVKEKSKFIELKVLKSGVQLTTSTIRKLSSDFADLEKEYSKLQSKIAKEVIDICSTYLPVLEMTNKIVAEMDVFLALANAAADAPLQFVCPEFEENGGLNIVGGRHPCLEIQDDVSFISNDTCLDRDSFFSIITGPNCGGKSTYIRQVGVICLLAQIGSFVPAASATLPILDAILARVGAGDKALKGISTFFAEMLETAAILRVATPRSLIIIDELGRGTSTKDGFGLAWAIAEYIAKNVSCFTLFATHFHEITSLSHHYPTVKNSHVSAHISESELARNLTLLYKVVDGPCDQSFGIHVAKLCEFPDSVVEMAKRKAAELEGFKEESAKRWKSTRDEIVEGGLVIEEFLKRFKSLDGLDGLGELRAEFKSLNCAQPFIQEVLREF